MKVFKWAKGIAVAFCVAALACTLAGCGGSKATNQQESEPEVITYPLHLYFKCDSNFLLSRYDIEVYVDGQEVGIVDHGSEASFDVDVEGGKHEVLLQEKDGKADARESVNVTEELYLTANLHCTFDQIEVSDLGTYTVAEVEAAQEAAEEEAAEEEAAKQAEEEAAAKEKAEKEAAEKEKKEAAQKKKDREAVTAKYGKFTYAYVVNSSEYDVYTAVNTKTKKVIYFTTNDAGVDKGTYSGRLSTGATVTWDNGDTEVYTWLDSDGSEMSTSVGATYQKTSLNSMKDALIEIGKL